MRVVSFAALNVQVGGYPRAGELTRGPLPALPALTRPSHQKEEQTSKPENPRGVLSERTW